MNRFLIFAGDNYYPRGGWNDVVGSFETLEIAIDYIARRNVLSDWIHIVDTKSCLIVWAKD